MYRFLVILAIFEKNGYIIDNIIYLQVFFFAFSMATFCNSKSPRNFWALLRFQCEMTHFLCNFSEKPGAQPYVTSPPPRRAIEENANLFFFVFSVFDLGEVQIALLLIFWVFRRNRNFWSRLVKNGQNCIFRNFRFFRKIRSNALIFDILLFF